MRILITTPVLPPELGGPATFVPQFAAHLHRRGHAVSVLSYADRPPAASEYPFRVTWVKRTFLPLRLASFFVTCLRLARRADVVLVCEHPALPSLLAAKIHRRPVVLRMMVNTAWELSYRFGLTRDDPDRFLAADGGLGVRAIKAAEGLTLRRADLVVAVSRHLGETAGRLGVRRDRILVSYNLPPPVAPAPGGRTEARERLGIAADVFLVLVVARLVDWKRVDTVIEALAKLPARCRLVVVGEGPSEARLRELSMRLGVEERATFTGRLDHEATRRFMQAADLLVLNSLYEGLSHVLLEAMASALPVLVSDVPGNRELVEHGDSGVVLPAGEGDALGQWIESLSGTPERLQRLGSRGRERALQLAARGSFERLAQRLEEIGAAGAGGR